MNMVTLLSIIVQNEEIAAAEMDEEFVMMNIKTGNYYSLGNTGSIIWKMLSQPILVDTLIENLMKRYQVTRQQCEEEVITFLNEMNREGLIHIK